MAAIANTRTPLAHVHVSGSAGTTFCLLARAQPHQGLAANSAYNCLLRDYGQTAWTYWLDVKSPMHHMHDLYGNCERLQHNGLKGYNVLGMFENVLFESNVSEHQKKHMMDALVLRNQKYNASYERGVLNCCCCTAQSFLSGHVVQNASVIVERGALSPFDEVFPLKQWRPYSTYCSNVRYSFLMHDPVHRVVTQAMLLCPQPFKKNSTCGQWAASVLQFIYSKDMALDMTEGIGFCGTPAASNYNLRMLLGPRVFFSRLGVPGQKHLRAAVAMIDNFAFVAPVAALGDPQMPQVLARSLGWRLDAIKVPHANQHSRKKAGELMQKNELFAQVGDVELRRHNALDIALYDHVKKLYGVRRDVVGSGGVVAAVGREGKMT